MFHFKKVFFYAALMGAILGASDASLASSDEGKPAIAIKNEDLMRRARHVARALVYKNVHDCAEDLPYPESHNATRSANQFGKLLAMPHMVNTLNQDILKALKGEMPIYEYCKTTFKGVKEALEKEGITFGALTE